MKCGYDLRFRSVRSDIFSRLIISITRLACRHIQLYKLFLCSLMSKYLNGIKYIIV